jgi:KipI family sensor histidine kinase inhibitor
VDGGRRVLRCGAEAVLVEAGDLDEVVGLHASLRARRPPGVLELVPGARTLLVTFDPARTTAAALAADLRAREPAPPERDGGRLVEIPTVYRGADLDAVAEHTGLTAREVVDRHAAGEYTVAFCGFSPGFAYLTGGDPALRVPRRADPRTKVPAGSVAIADAFTGVYPRELPGGWQLLGHTDVSLWDLDRDPPALLAPGTRVRFVEVSR